MRLIDADNVVATLEDFAAIKGQHQASPQIDVSNVIWLLNDQPTVTAIDDENFSDGYHTFAALYEQRKYLFAALVKVYKSNSWKSKRHEDEEVCFDGNWFIVGIDTPAGTYTYHYKLEDWNLFDCIELECGKPWDGHTDKDVNRVMSL